MGLFSYSNEQSSIFLNEDSLDPEWVPKLLPFRDNQQKRIASCVKPLLEKRNGINVLVYGPSGVGKTCATKWVLRELEEEFEDVHQCHINCWQKNTTYKVATEICAQLGYNFVQNKNTEDLMDIVKNIVNKKTAVFVFDEIDKAEDYDFLYTILNDVYKKTIILITNYKSWFDQLENRIKSRLLPDLLEFQAYSVAETESILDERSKFAFRPGTVEREAIKPLAQKAVELEDIRIGLHLLREAGRIAEEKGTKVNKEAAELAIKKIEQINLKKDVLLEDEQLVLDLIKNNSGQKIGDLYKKYQERGGQGNYKTFQRRIEKLTKANFVTAEKQMGGTDGTTTFVTYGKKLTEY